MTPLLHLKKKPGYLLNLSKWWWVELFRSAAGSVGEAGSSLVSAHPGLLCILMPFPQNDPRERFWDYEIGAKNNLSKLLLMESCALLNYAVSWKMPPPHSKMQIFIVKRRSRKWPHSQGARTSSCRALGCFVGWIILAGCSDHRRSRKKRLLDQRCCETQKYTQPNFQRKSHVLSLSWTFPWKYP